MILINFVRDPATDIHGVKGTDFDDAIGGGITCDFCHI